MIIHKNNLFNYIKSVVILVLFFCAAACDKRESQLTAQVLKEYPSANKEIIQRYFKINRKYLLAPVSEDRLFRNETHPIGYGQVASSPLLHIILAQELLVDKNHIVLEIGTGSGIQTALLAGMAKEVYSIEIHRALALKTKKKLNDLGYENITIIHGDGYKGWPYETLQFDRIVLTCSFKKVPPLLIKQLRENGLLLMPLGKAFQGQQLVRFRKKKGVLVKDAIIRTVHFVPMIH